MFVRLTNSLNVSLVQSKDPHGEETDENSNMLQDESNVGTFTCLCLVVHQRDLGG